MKTEVNGREEISAESVGQTKNKQVQKKTRLTKQHGSSDKSGMRDNMESQDATSKEVLIPKDTQDPKTMHSLKR